MTLVPSYGRDYKSQKAVLADWNANKDFTIANFHSPDDGRQCNKDSFPPGQEFIIRYKQLRNVVKVKS